MTKVVSGNRKGKLSSDEALFVTRQNGSQNWYFRYTIPLWHILTDDIEPDHELAAKVLLAVLEKGGDGE